MSKTPARILELGEVDYAKAHRLQLSLLEKRLAGEIADTWLFLTHPPTITFGRSSHAENLLANERELKEQGIELHEIERGGDVTFHGPGQQIIYPIVDLKERGRDVHRFLRDLEELVIRFLAGFSVAGRRVEGKTGVWVEDRKICSIGVAVRRWVSYHGLALNLTTDLNFFRLIQPCGLPSQTMISLQDLLDLPIDKPKAFYGLVRSIEEVFAVEIKL
ncbi:MAG: lipoyl(octanoyl) transferase LipB [bacterium]